MLTITIDAREFFDNLKQEFVTVRGRVLRLEHSLISISKWESKWHKPFLSEQSKTNVEVVDYIRCMTLDPNVPDEVFSYLTPKQYEIINDYISDPMTATTITDRSKATKKAEVMTSELIYYYMIAQNIPMECERWHINRLLTLIRVCGIKSQPQSKRSNKDVLRDNAALNAARKKQLNTRG